MKKITCMFIMLFLFLISCRKDNVSSKEESSTLSSKVIDANFKRGLRLSLTHTADLNLLIPAYHVANWAEAQSLITDTSETIFIPLLKPVFMKQAISGQVDHEYLELKVKNNKVFDPQVRQIYTSTTTVVDKSLLQISSKNDKTKSFSGTVTLFDLSDRHKVNSFTYKEGSLSNYSSIKAANTSGNPKIKVQDCTYYYLNTYYDDGSVDHEYLYSSCDECAQESISVPGKGIESVIKVNCQGSPGGGTPTPSAGGSTVANSPLACLSRFAFTSQGNGPMMKTVNIWGVFAKLFVEDAQHPIGSVTFGMRLDMPNQIEAAGVTFQQNSQANYPGLWQTGDIYTTTLPNGNFAIIFSDKAKAVIARDATDYASTWADKTVLDPDVNPAGGEIYKGEFKSLYTDFIQTYAPGSRIQISGSQLPGDILFTYTLSNPFLC